MARTLRVVSFEIEPNNSHPYLMQGMKTFSSEMSLLHAYRQEQKGFAAVCWLVCNVGLARTCVQLMSRTEVRGAGTEAEQG